MKIIKHIISISGILFVTILMLLLIYYGNAFSRLKQFDDKAFSTYAQIAERLIKTGNAAEATIWKVKADSDLSAEDVEETMISIANELNIKIVGELPLYKQISAMTGEDVPYMKIFMFCNPLTAAKMVEFNHAFSAYLPCRITLLEDNKGDLWIYTLNMDMMIYGGKPLPNDIKQDALRIKSVIQEIMTRGARGDF